MIPIYKSSQENKLHAFVILLIIVLTSSIHIAFGQQLSGTVTDKETGEPIPFANIIVVQPYCALPIGASTDFDGKFKLLIDSGTYDLRVAFVGYEQMIVKDVRVLQDKEVDISMKLAQSVLICCTMACYSSSRFDFNWRRPRINITPEQISAIPSVVGTLDIARYLEVVPGAVRIKNKKKRAVKPALPVELKEVKIISYSCDGSSIVKITPEKSDIVNTSEEIYEVGNLELPHNESRNEGSLGLKFYPNPTAGQLTLELEGDIEIINLTDMSGKVLEWIPVKDMDQAHVDLSAYPNGIYFLQYYDGEKMSSGKVVLAN